MKKRPELWLCIVMDIIGSATYLVPGIAEVVDFVWAPISAIIFYKMFGGWKGAFGAVFNFAEEILPATDIIPTFTIAWVWMYLKEKKSTQVFISKKI